MCTKWPRPIAPNCRSGSAFVQAEIVTARELGDDERNTLIAGVGKLAGARIEANFKLDQIDSRRRRGAHRIHGLRRLGSRTAGATERSIGGGMKAQFTVRSS